MGSNGYMVVDGIQVHTVERVSQSKSGNVWIYNTVCTGCTRGLLTSIDPQVPPLMNREIYLELSGTLVCANRMPDG